MSPEVAKQLQNALDAMEHASAAVERLGEIGAVCADDIAEMRAAMDAMQSALQDGRLLDAVAASRRARARCDVLLGVIFGFVPPIGRA